MAANTVARQCALVTTARLQYERNGHIDLSTVMRLGEAGYIVDELIDSFNSQGEDIVG